MQPDPLDSVPENLRAALGLLHPPEETVPSKPPAANGRPNPPNPSESGRVSTERLVSRALGNSGAGRNDAGFWLAGQLRDNGYVQSQAETVLLDYQRHVPPANTKGQREPYRRDEALASVREAYKRTPRDPWTKRQGTEPVYTSAEFRGSLWRHSGSTRGFRRSMRSRHLPTNRPRQRRIPS